MWLTQALRREPAGRCLETRRTQIAGANASRYRRRKRRRKRTRIRRVSMGGGFDELGLLPSHYSNYTVLRPSATPERDNRKTSRINPSTARTVRLILSQLRVPSPHPRPVTLKRGLRSRSRLSTNQPRGYRTVAVSSILGTSLRTIASSRSQVSSVGRDSPQAREWPASHDSVECRARDPRARCSSASLARGTCVRGCLVPRVAELRPDRRGNEGASKSRVFSCGRAARSRKAGGARLPSAGRSREGFARRRVAERGSTKSGHGRCRCTTSPPR